MIVPRGRTWVAFWLVVVLGTLGWVVARQTASVVVARDLVTYRSQRSVMEAERAMLLGRIREAESRGTLVPRAEGWGLRLPADSEITIIRSTARRRP